MFLKSSWHCSFLRTCQTTFFEKKKKLFWRSNIRGDSHCQVTERNEFLKSSFTSEIAVFDLMQCMGGAWDTFCWLCHQDLLICALSPHHQSAVSCSLAMYELGQMGGWCITITGWVIRRSLFFCKKSYQIKDLKYSNKQTPTPSLVSASSFGNLA